MNDSIPFTDPATPARDILELAEYLGEYDQETRYVYRGQTKDYQSLVPSYFRNVKGRVQNGAYMFDAAPDRIDPTERVRRGLMDYFIGEFGKFHGNIIAQQYLNRSECIDVTSLIGVAVFFATKGYPDFKAPHRDGLGIIYRIDYARLNLAALAIGSLDPTEETNTPVFDGETRLRLLDKQKCDAPPSNPGQYYAQHNLAPVVPIPTRQETCQSLPYVVLYEELVSYLMDRVKGFDVQDCTVTDPATGHAMLGRSRFLKIVMQAGGCIMPSFLWDCAVPTDAKYETQFKEGRGKVSVRDDVLLAQRCVGLADLDGLDCVEKFYFRHTGLDIAATREEIFPSPDYDLSYKMFGATAQVLRANLGLNDVVRMNDVVDRGYEGNEL